MINKKQFGVWMDTHTAIIIGKEDAATSDFTVLAHVTGEDTPPNTSEKNSNHQERSLTAKYFKEICTHLQNATHIHLTGTGQIQEQFMKFLADTPQFKNTVTDESTANKMSDERLIEFMAAKMN